MCCSAFTTSAMPFSMLCVVVCCSVLQCHSIPQCCSVLQCHSITLCVSCSVLQYDVVRCSALQCMCVSCSVLQYASVRCSMMQCVAVPQFLSISHTHTYKHTHKYTNKHIYSYGVAATSRLLKIIGLFCKRDL